MYITMQLQQMTLKNNHILITVLMNKIHTVLMNRKTHYFIDAISFQIDLQIQYNRNNVILKVKCDKLILKGIWKSNAKNSHEYNQ